MKKLISLSLLLFFVGFISTAVAQVPTSGLQLHLKADAGISVSTDGNPVATWADQSGNGNDATQATAGNQPLFYNSGINSQPVVRFDGTDDFLQLPTLSALGIQNSDYEMFIVYKSATTTNSIQFLTAAAIEHMEVHTNGAYGMRFIPNNSGSNYLDVGATGDYTNQQPQLIGVQGTNGSGKLTVNGADSIRSAVSAQSSNNGNLRIGQRADGGYPLNGDIAEIIIYNTTLSDLDRGAVENYLGNKYGVDVPVASPSIQSSNLTVSEVTGTSVKLNVTPGNGSKRIIIASGSTFTDPENGQTYEANSAFGSGSQLGSFTFVVYKGSGNEVTVSNLNPNTFYDFYTFEFNGSGGEETYLVENPAFAVQRTLSSPTEQTTNIKFSNVTDNSMTLSVTEGNGDGRIIIAKSDSAVDFEPVDGQTYTANPNFGSSANLGNGNYVVYAGSGNQVDITGLNASTMYHFYAIEYNIASGEELYYRNNPKRDNQQTKAFPAVETQIPIENLKLHLKADGFSNISQGDAIATWNDQSGNGNDAIQNTAEDRPTFSSINDINGQPVILFNGQESMVLPNLPDLGIQSNDYEIFILYRTNFNNTEEQYLLSATSGDFEIALNNTYGMRYIPNSSSSNIGLGSLGEYSNGLAQLVNIQGSAASGKIIMNANDSTRAGTSAHSFSNNTITIGLNAGYTEFFNGYIAEIIVYNTVLTSSDREKIENYLGNKYAITVRPSVQTSDLVTSETTNTTLKLNLTPGNGANRIILAKAGSAVDAFPSDSTVYTANASFGSGSQIGTGNFVVYKGNGDEVSLSGLSPNTDYHFYAVESNGSNGEELYRFTNPATAVQKTTNVPTVQTTNVQINSLTNTSVDLSVTPGNGANRIIIAKEGSAVDAFPVDGTAYTANTAFGSGTQIGTGNFVVYSGTGNTVTITGLSPNTDYHFYAVEFNNDGGNEFYLSDTPATASQTTKNTPTVQTSTIQFSDVSQAAFNLSVTSGNGDKRIILAKAGSAVDAFPSDSTVYTADASFGSGSQIGSGNFVVYNGSGNNVSLTGLSANTTYHFYAVEYNDGTGEEFYLSDTPATASQATKNTPTVQTSAIQFSSVTNTTLDLSLTPGNGTNRIIIAKAGVAVDVVLSDSVTYTADAAFGNGAEIGTGNFVVYNGTGSSVSITGLTADVTYHFYAVEYNLSGGEEMYLIESPATANRQTANIPTVQASNIQTSNVTNTSMTVSLTPGNGTNRIIIVKSGAGNDVDGFPVDGQAYAANAEFGSGAQIGSGNFVVYNGTGNEVTITGLTAGVRHYFYAVEFSVSEGEEVYLNTTPLTTNRTTTNFPTVQANAQAGAITNTSIDLTYTRGNGGNIIILAKAGSAVDAFPRDSVSYSANAQFGSGSEIGNGNFVVQRTHLSSGTASITGLNPNTTYHFYAIELDGSVEFNYYLRDNPVTFTATTSNLPTVQAENIQFSSVSNTSLNLSLTTGNGSKRIIIAKAGSAVDAFPSDSTSYTANVEFGSGSEIGTGNFVVYNGSGNSVSLTGLSANTTYHFYAVEYNGNGGEEEYLLQNPATGTQKTMNVPTQQASDIQITNKSFSSFDISVTAGNGSNRLIIIKAGSAVDALPTDSTTYTATILNLASGQKSERGIL